MRKFNELGLESVVVSKDISLDDILDVAKRNPLFATILVYGHYTLFYSKRKLVENYFYAYEKEPEKCAGRKRNRIEYWC